MTVHNFSTQSDTERVW